MKRIGMFNLNRNRCDGVSLEKGRIPATMTVELTPSVVPVKRNIPPQKGVNFISEGNKILKPSYLTVTNLLT